ncbi:MAG: head GIN domain-containing protein [Stygiobacter sp.]
MKKKTLFIILTLLLSFNACTFWGVRGNGKLKTQTRNIENFDRLEVGGVFSVKVEIGKEASLKIQAEENLLPLIKTNVVDGTLIIETKKGLNPRREIKILITTPDLNYVEVSGANSLQIFNIDEDVFEVNLSGAGSIYLKGKVEKLYADLSGAGSIDSKDLIANVVEISVSGAASADVFAKERINASVSGVGSINYYGNPQYVKTNISGVGSINRK